MNDNPPGYKSKSEMKRVEALKAADNPPGREGPRDWKHFTFKDGRVGAYHSTNEVYEILDAYDALLTKLESAQEGERFYRQEWESACERYNYQKEEADRLAAELEKHRWRQVGAQVDPTPEVYAALEAERDKLAAELAELSERYLQLREGHEHVIHQHAAELAKIRKVLIGVEDKLTNERRLLGVAHTDRDRLKAELVEAKKDLSNLSEALQEGVTNCCKHTAELARANARLKAKEINGTLRGYDGLADERDALAAQFKNFHRMICEAAGYCHDEVDWKRDQASLENAVRALAAQIEELRLAKPNAGSTDTLTEKYRLRRERDQLKAELVEARTALKIALDSGNTVIKERDQLRTRLETAIKALEFYANNDTWRGVYSNDFGKGSMVPLSEGDSDWLSIDGEAQYIGGKRAREALDAVRGKK